MDYHPEKEARRAVDNEERYEGGYEGVSQKPFEDNAPPHRRPCHRNEEIIHRPFHRLSPTDDGVDHVDSRPRERDQDRAFDRVSPGEHVRAGQKEYDQDDRSRDVTASGTSKIGEEVAGDGTDIDTSTHVIVPLLQL